MTSKIFSFVKISDDSIVASVRIARFITNTLGLPIVWDESIAAEKLDALIIVNGAYAFSGNSILEALGRAIEDAGVVIWIQNDYTVIPPKDVAGAESPFRRAFRNRHERTKKPSVSFWTTVEVMSRPDSTAPSGHLCGEHSCYVNWNALTLDLDAPPPKPWADRACPGSMLYYGSFRKDREREFDRYFSAPGVPTVFSCPTRKAEERYPLLTHETKLVDLRSYLSEFGLGLYLEDKKSHVEFHSPANRHYEMLSAGLPMVFQPESMKMMRKAGYDVSPYVLWRADEAPGLMSNARELLTLQRAQWMTRAIEERRELEPTLRKAWSELT